MFTVGNVPLREVSDDVLQRMLAECAAEALAVQDACNLSGVVYGWARVMDVICEVSHRQGKGTEWKNQHPVNILFADKVVSLAGVQGMHDTIGQDRCYKAMIACRELAKVLKPEVAA